MRPWSQVPSVTSAISAQHAALPSPSRHSRCYTSLCRPTGRRRLKPVDPWRCVAASPRPRVPLKENVMMTLATLGLGSLLLAQVSLSWLIWLAIIFFIIALVAYAVGATGVAGMSAGVGRTLLFVCLVLAVIFLIAGLAYHPAV